MDMDWITEELRARGMTQRDFARLIGMTEQMLTNVKKGRRRFSAEEVDRIRRAFFDFDAPEAGGGPVVVRAANRGADIAVPIYSATASAGHGAELQAYDLVEDHLSFPPGYLREITSTSAKHLAIIRTKGDSMVPTIAEDDLVMVDTTKTDLSFDGIFVIRDDGASLLVKRIQRGTRRGHILVVSDNERYRPTERPLSEVECLGKVVWMGVRV